MTDRSLRTTAAMALLFGAAGAAGAPIRGRARLSPARGLHTPAATTPCRIQTNLRRRRTFFQAGLGIEFERAWLDAESPGRTNELHGYLLDRAEFQLARVDRRLSATERVTRWINARTELARPTLAQVARELGTSTRSLRRRLHQERTQFSALIDSALAVHAKRMLQDPQRGIQDTAYALGFRTPSAFSRAFKRWTGMEPRAYRKAHEAEPS